MFVDEVKISLRAGTGGNGASTFRRAKNASRGGPDGGDGGSGGSVFLAPSAAMTTLLDFRFKSHYKAESGGHGHRSTWDGKTAPDLTLQVPVGTVVRDAETREVLADLVEEGTKFLVVAGGRGGRGNARFASATNQAPRFAENGEPGQERELHLELKVMADVGLVGLPNAGKSSLLNRISAARPKIADYPFTTLTPVLGVVSLGNHRSCVIADIPGLIEGAHEGLGLGHQFLRHVERTRALIHVLDASGDVTGDAIGNLDVVTRELELHNPELARLPLLVAANKIDITPEADVQELCSRLAERNLEVFPISAATGQGIEALLYRVAEMLPVAETHKTHGSEAGSSPNDRAQITMARRQRVSREWSVAKEPDGAWRVAGEGLERLVAMTNVNNDSALERLDRVLERNGIVAALKSAGVGDGDMVRVRNTEFVFVEKEKLYEQSRSRRKKKTQDPEE